MSKVGVKRFNAQNPCPVCSGFDAAPRGKGKRCHGYVSTDGKFIHCSREEHAGDLPVEENASTYAHRRTGACRCGTEHAPADPPRNGHHRMNEKNRTARADDEGELKPWLMPDSWFAGIYDYRDEQGRLLYQVLRTPAKNFKARRPVDDGQGGRKWEWNVKGTRIVLYRLPELLAADPAAPVYIAEGEKDVDNLRRLGVVAICNPFGAKKWTTWESVRECARAALRDRHVVIIPDEDADGAKHADQVAAEVVTYVASIRRISLAPAKPVKGWDASDWIAAGGTADQLEALRAAAAPNRVPNDDDVFAVRDAEQPGAPRPTATSATPSSVEWVAPAPIGSHLPPVPAFEVNLLPADLQGWVCDIAHRMSVPVDLPAVAAMCAVSVVAANARTIHPKRRDPWRVWPILWGASIAPPGSKKTPATKEAFGPLQRLDIRARQEFARGQSQRAVEQLIANTELQVVKEQLKAAARAKQSTSLAETVELKKQLEAAMLKAEEDEFIKPRRYLAQDATIEKITDIVGLGPSRRAYPLGVLWDELLGFFRQFDRDGHETDRVFYLEGWSVSTRATDRIQRGSIITRDLALVVFGNATPEPFEAYVRDAGHGRGADGLLQRFQMMVYPDRFPPGPMVDEFRDAMAEQRAIRLFERLASIDEEDDEKRPPALRFSHDAQDFYFEWEAELQRELATSEDHHAIRAHFAKYASLMPAIALICHLASGEGSEHEPVSLWAAQQAAGWCQYLKAHALRIYSLAVDPERAIAAMLAKKIERGDLVGEMTVREAYRKAKIDPEGAKGGLELLDDLGWVRLASIKTAGRPKEMVTFNPRARTP